VLRIRQKAVSFMTHPGSRPNRNLSGYLDLAAQNPEDLRQSEQAQRERERLLDSLIGLLPGSAYRALADKHWTALFVSKGIEDVTGYPPDEFTSGQLNYNDIILPEDRSATREAVVTALRERRVFDIEHRIRNKDGSVRWIWARGHGVFAPDGSLRFIEGWNLDITRRKQAEEELRLANARLELAVRGSNVGVWDLDLPNSDYNRRRRHYVNVWEQLGYDGPPAGRESALDEADPDDRAHLEEAVRRYLTGEAPEFETEIRLRHRDGSYRTMLARGAAVRDATGKPIRMGGVIIDITALKRAEEELRHVNTRLDLAVRGSNLAIWEFDTPDGRIENSRQTFINVWESLGYDAATSPTDFA
jgi:PAS domain S-box-containing protein